MRDPREVLTRQAPPPAHTLSYGTGPDQVIDVWPGGETLAVLLHGGFWRPEYDRTHLRPMANALAEAGFTVAVPEYRRLGFPTILDDVAAALDRSYGMIPERTVWAGHSAGGHLALWASLRHHLPADAPWRLAAPPRVDQVIALAACSDLALTARWGLDGDAAEALMHGTPQERPGDYALADPAALLPVTVPTILIHGTDDDRVPVGMSRAFAADAANEGAPLTVVECPGVEHFGLIDPLAPVWPRVLAAFYGRSV